MKVISLLRWLAPLFFALSFNVSVRAESSCAACDYFANWFARVEQTRNEQPHWVVPMVTPSPALQEVLRYDISHQMTGSETQTIYGYGKSLEFIPAERLQVSLSVPTWETKNTTPRKEGWADECFQVKYRIASANEDNGNYVACATLGLAVPTGGKNYSTGHYVFTPGFGFGKGWGNFDIQSSACVAIPENNRGWRNLGTPIIANVAAQYRVGKFCWPETELNYCYFPNGPHEGLNQAFITPGLLLGRFPIARHLAFACGIGYQIAVTEHPLYRRNLLFTLRLPF